MFVSQLTVAILAGGAATRLDGRDKGLEPLRDRPLVAWVIDALHGMELPALLIVANRNRHEYEHYASTIADSLSGFRGPLAGVAAALAACTTPMLLTVPVDCPDPPRDLVRRFLDSMRMDEANALVAHDGERRQPLFALYSRELAASAAAAAEAGQGVWAWQASIGARELDFSDRQRQFHNLNTREEFAAYAAERRLAP